MPGTPQLCRRFSQVIRETSGSNAREIMLFDCCAPPRAKEEDMKALLRLKVTRAEETRIVASSRRRFPLEALAALLVIILSAVPGDAPCDPSTHPGKSDIASAP